MVLGDSNLLDLFVLVFYFSFLFFCYSTGFSLASRVLYWGFASHVFLVRVIELRALNL
jgi:hypothetical protein